MLTPAMTRKSVSALDWIRTNDTRFRRAVLYPLSYEGLSGRLPADRPAHDHSGFGVAPWRAKAGSPRRVEPQARPHGVEVREVRRSPLAWCVGATSTGHEA